MTVAERRSNFNLTIDTPYLTLTGELWGVCCERLEKYNGTILWQVIGWHSEVITLQTKVLLLFGKIKTML